MIEFLAKKLDWLDVQYWFYIFNDLSLFYIIVPFFALELIRYAYLKRLDKDLVLDSIANVVTFGAFFLIEIILGILAITKVYYWVYNNISLPHLELNWATLICCVLLADFAYYWEHRTMHRIGIGWATHTVHHSSPHFNMSVAYRFGPLDAIMPIVFSLPIVMLGFDPILVLLSEVFVQVFQTLLHTEIIGKLTKPVEFIFNTPSHHRVHHGSNRQYWDKNYAGILIIWDRMLGTFEPEKEKVVYGISQPINSVNPIVVFFHGITRFVKKLRQIKGFSNKLLAFVKPPDWMPKP
ncbi:sterol desaturase family protein [Flagellimonas pacifica]|uniref:Sterol desaturase/sphingolipid hydroxylase, fatty acid hydroxylase superfamily n=1 Tax=Flagellimonas pacifica TaxID=1247520 RepID=A0A285MUR1_9FLAO|nr:sterol desaturase family protein [Allomuricauda parva]SNZ00922.1 Sterol desaturase/sphingolipid hydroxylase, fatty acid hydroxylase superfamily [Allomuricauda parva]